MSQDPDMKGTGTASTGTQKHPYSWTKKKVPVSQAKPVLRLPGTSKTLPLAPSNSLLSSTNSPTSTTNTNSTINSSAMSSATSPRLPIPKLAADTPTKPQDPSKPGETLIISERQRNNPLTMHISQVRYEFSEQLKVDFLPCEDAGILFLSLRYHLCNMEYIKIRVAQATKYKNNILLVLVDTPDHRNPLREINILALKKDLTMITVWSNREAARYIETYRAYSKKSSDSIKAPVTTNFLEQYVETITSIRSVNSTDAMTLMRNFGNLNSIMNATHEQLILCPGIGEKKVRTLYDAFHKPFVTSTSPKKTKRRKTTLNSFVRVKPTGNNGMTEDKNL